jgi:uncharacterized protein YndB with AHSA1/START domain
VNTHPRIPSDRPEFTLERTFNAPCQLVYKVWTDPQYVKQWWGVDGCTIVFCEMDVRPGGSFRIDMRTKDGTVYVNRGVYLDVVANERIVTRDEREAHTMPGNIPAGVHTVTFDDIEGKTLVRLTSRFENVEERDLMVQFGIVDGIQQSLERFERLVTLTMQERQQQ